MANEQGCFTKLKEQTKCKLTEKTSDIHCIRDLKKQSGLGLVFDCSITSVGNGLIKFHLASGTRFKPDPACLQVVRRTLILNASTKGVLLVVDNFETIHDQRIVDFVKDIPRPNKVLITSRMGLGEVERRYPLKELNKTDAIALIRTIAREKGIKSLAALPDEVLHKYAQRMSSYPLAIKWVIGQAALGKDIEQLVDGLTSTSGDIAQFCFEHIYESLLSGEAKIVLCSLAASDAPLTRGVLTHVSGLNPNQLDEALRHLAIASLVIPEQEKGNGDSIVTKYALLPLTWGYLREKLRSQPGLWRTIQDRMELVSNRMEEAARAGKSYRYALQDLLIPD